MKKLLILAVIAGGLAGCASIQTAYQVVSGVTITQEQLDAAVAAYDTAVLTPYNLYRYTDASFRTPRRYCTKAAPFSANNPCASYTLLAKIQPILRAVENSRVDLQIRVTQCNVARNQSACQGIAAAKAVFDAAVSSAKTTMFSLGVI